MNGRDILDAVSPGSLIRGSRSTALHPLTWMATLFVSGLVTSVFAGAPEWVLYLLAGGLSLTFLVFLISYVYFGLTDKDALRSENFAIQKLQIERGIVGDSESGFRKTIEGRVTSNPNLSADGEQ